MMQKGVLVKTSVGKTCNCCIGLIDCALTPTYMLTYLGEYAGVKRVKTLRLNRSSQECYASVLGGASVFFWPFEIGPDYAIVAQSATASELLTACSHFAEPEGGSRLSGRRSQKFYRQRKNLGQDVRHLQDKTIMRWNAWRSVSADYCSLTAIVTSHVSH